MNPAEAYILKQPEPLQSILMHVRFLILSNISHTEEKYNYSVPFYHYRKRPFVYINILKGQQFVDVAFVKGAELQKRFPQLKDYNNRKHVRSLQYKNLEDIDETVLLSVLKAAAALIDR